MHKKQRERLISILENTPVDEHCGTVILYYKTVENIIDMLKRYGDVVDEAEILFPRERRFAAMQPTMKHINVCHALRKLEKNYGQ